MKRTNVELDEAKITRAKRITGLKTTKAVLDAALADLVRRDRLKGLLALRGRVRFWDGYDVAALRRSRA